MTIITRKEHLTSKLSELLLLRIFSVYLCWVKNIFRILLAIYAILILALSVAPSWGIDNLQAQNQAIRIDYILHALAFLVIPLFAFIASGYSCTTKQWFYYLTIATLLAIGAEFIQIVTPTRTFNPFDVLSNLFGLSVGILSARIWCRRRIQKQKQNPNT
jgi:VanZ family protein